MKENDSFVRPATPRIVSMVAHAMATITRDTDPAKVILWIRSGKWREPVEKIRVEFARVLKETGDENAAKAAVRRMKEKLPGILPSGRFSSRNKPTAQQLMLHSGLLCADLDNLGERLPRVRRKLEESPYLWAMFTSPTGNGLKCLFLVPADAAKHRDSFLAVQQHVRELTGEEIDTDCRDVARLCYASFDPDALLRANAIELPLTLSPIRLPPASASCVTTSLPSCITASLHNTPHPILENISNAMEAHRLLKSTRPLLAKLYTAIVEKRFQALPHGRNEFLTQAIPFLYRAVAEHLILDLVAHFYDCNRAFFYDAREQHLREARAMLNSVIATYRTSLGEHEHAIYEAFSRVQRDMFRICRDLALLPDAKHGPLTLYASFEHFGLRLELHPPQAQRIMRQLEGVGLLKLLEKGERRAPGVKPKAGIYKWLLPPSSTANDSTPSIP